MIPNKTLEASLQDRVAELERVNATLLSEKTERNRLLDAAHQKQDSLQQALQQRDNVLRQKDEQLRNFMDEMGKLRRKEAALRATIPDKAGIQNVSDQEVISRFTALRQKIQTITRLPLYNMEQLVQTRRMEPEAANFYEAKAWEPLTIEERRNRVRSKMFDILHKDILTFRLFGLEGYSTWPKAAKAEGGLVTPGLRRFKNALEEHRGT